MDTAYDNLADWFEILNDDCDYPKWSQYFIERLKSYGAGVRGLEIGCGSGAFCRALVKEGYVMTGADISLPMLTKAQALSAKEGLHIEYILSDAVSIRTSDKFDFVISPNDCFNYIAPKKLSAVFSHAADCLKKGGIFHFDISSPYKLRGKVANNIMYDDREDITYLAQNTLFDDRVEMEVTLFVRGTQNKYTRYDERHVQYIHEEEFILNALAKRFEVLRVEGHLGEEKTNSDRLNFICRKK